MACSLPVTPGTRRGRKSEEEELQREEPSYRVTAEAVKRFVLCFFVLYGVMALSVFSVFAVNEKNLDLVTETSTVEVGAGEEATFTVSVENPSILGKEFTLVLEKEIPNGWTASFCDESQCFYDTCTESVGSLQGKPYKVNVITDSLSQTGTVSLRLYREGMLCATSQFTIRTRDYTDFQAILKETERDSASVSFTIAITNAGNVPDVYTVFVSPGVTAQVSEDRIELGPGEEKEIKIFIEEKGSINTSLMIRSSSGKSETLYLICEQNFHYDFELYSPKEAYIDSPEKEVTFDIVNTGDAPDSYSVSATCLSPGWEVFCTPDKVSLPSNKSERVKIIVKRGEGKNTSIIVTATSESGLSKNIKMAVYTQETRGKTVLAEYFTGTWCYVCSYGERAIRQLAEEYRSVIVLVYHLKDDIETPSSQKRSKDVYGFTDSVSTLVVNGTKHVYYTSGGEGTIYFRYKKIIEELMPGTAKAEIYVSGHVTGNTAYIAAEIRPHVVGSCDVYFVLFKNNFAYRGDIKQYIVRDVADPQRITLAGDEIMVSCVFTLPNGESFKDYGVVVILQNPETLEVLQATSYML